MTSIEDGDDNSGDVADVRWLLLTLTVTLLLTHRDFDVDDE
jgi:hypothetical protein